MRIVAWNCAKAFHNKIDRLLALQPDVAVVSECADPEVLARQMPPARIFRTANLAR